LIVRDVSNQTSQALRGPAKPIRRLLAIPTYNEAQNIDRLLSSLLKIEATFDILIVDDSSPDGTSDVVRTFSAKNERIKLLQRPGKLGIGSAHREAIFWAYKNNYSEIATMDADLTHAPEDLARLFNCTENADVIITSRFILPGSLPGWNMWRLALTQIGHVATRFLLGMPYDSTGALRLYKIEKIPKRIFELAISNGYSFIFEILLLLHANSLKIVELPVVLPSRIIGSSKMNFREIRLSVELLFRYFIVRLFLAERLRVTSSRIKETDLQQEQVADSSSSAWDDYWGSAYDKRPLWYDILAGFYRRWIIRPAFENSITSTFAPNSSLLHAGCGTGQVDVNLIAKYRIIALDFSVRALELYQATNGSLAEVKFGSILSLPFPDCTFDGIYNLGVMEHFENNELEQVLREFKRVLKPQGKIVLWWPPEFGSSVRVFKFFEQIYSLLKIKREHLLYPAEISRIKDRTSLEQLLNRCGLKLSSYEFGVRDLCTQVTVTAEPIQ